jgi:hypothetical protein
MVAVVNEAFARRSFGDRSPLGQHLTLASECPKCDLEIVGVAANTLYGNLKETPRPTAYLSFAQAGWGPVERWCTSRGLWGIRFAMSAACAG